MLAMDLQQLVDRLSAEQRNELQSYLDQQGTTHTDTDVDNGIDIDALLRDLTILREDLTDEESDLMVQAMNVE